jgi:hypothetical protein
MLIVFPYTKKADSSEIYYCCCRKSDYEIHGVQIVTNMSVPKGVSDEPEEAIQDFGIILQLLCTPSEQKICIDHASEIQIIREVAVLKTH